MFRNRNVVGMVASVALAACLTVTAGTKDYTDLSERWEKAYNAGDAAALAALYAENGTVMPPDAKAAQGRDAIRAYIEQSLEAAPDHTLEIESVESDKSGNLGYARGTWRMKDSSGHTLDEGKWIEVRRKVGGEWLIHCDTWNSDLPKPETHEH